MNAREQLAAIAEWLGYQEESLSFGLRNSMDALRLYDYAQAHPDLPEMADEWQSIHLMDALGYNPLETEGASMGSNVGETGASTAHAALLQARALIDSVAFVAKEGDSTHVLASIDAVIGDSDSGLSRPEMRISVARAICTACNENPDQQGDASGKQYRWQDYLGVADAAISAMPAAAAARAPLAETIGAVFDALIRAHLGDKNYFEVASRNRDEIEPGICHTHDFCDANQVMLTAFEKVAGYGPNIQSPSDMAILDAAWTSGTETMERSARMAPPLIDRPHARGT